MILTFVLEAATPAFATTVTLAPGEDWCAAANSASPGDEIVLQAGDHAGPCTLATPGTEGAPITVRGEDSANLPRIVYNGANSNVIDVNADWVTVKGLAFGPTQADIDGIKVKDGDHVTVEGNTFNGVGGISVSANSVDTVGLTIRGNTFQDLDATAMYLGCHDGKGSCAATDLLVEGNLIDGVSSPSVGYGLEVKQDSWGVVRDNVIADTQGPGIEIFGSEDLKRPVRVEGNLVVRSRNNASIEVGGPGVTVVNNVVVGGAEGGIYVYAYWESVHDVIVAGNTVAGETGAAIRVSSDVTASRMVDNAASQSDGSSPFPAALAGLSVEANVTCASPDACWANGAGWDFRPTEGGGLLTAGVAESTLTADFCGVSRGSAPTAGAFESVRSGSARPLTIALKSSIDCTTGSEPDPDTAADTAADDVARRDDSGAASAEGCGCAPAESQTGASGIVGVLGFVLVGRRRRIVHDELRLGEPLR